MTETKTVFTGENAALEFDNLDVKFRTEFGTELLEFERCQPPVEQLVDDGIRSKIAQITEDGQAKLQDSMQKIVNDSRGGMVCIII